MKKSIETSSWMPLWLATWIFVVGSIVSIGIGFLFLHELVAVGVIESAMELGKYEWLVTIVAITPWVWYFAYIRYRYLEKVPGVYYILWGIPFITPIVNTTLWRGMIGCYVINFTVGGLIALCLIVYIIYELYNVLQKLQNKERWW